jgi:hypothetical protein
MILLLTLIVVLLAVITYNTTIKKFTKKRHFKNKLEVTQRKILDVEFLLDNYKQMREGFRTEYDRIKEELDGVETYEFLIKKLGVEEAKEVMKDAEKSYKLRDEMKDEKDKELNKEEEDILTNLKNNIVGKKNDMEILKKQMKDVDVMIEGDPEQPASVSQSVNQNLSNLRSVIDMLRQIIKKL